MKIKFPLFLSLVLFLGGCQSGLIHKNKLHTMNQEYSQTIFVAKSDIKPDFMNPQDPPLFRKGEKVKIWVESSPDWIRVKAYGIKERREQTPGRTIIYFFRDEMPEKVDEMGILDFLNARLEAILTEESTGA